MELGFGLASGKDLMTHEETLKKEIKDLKTEIVILQSQNRQAYKQGYNHGFRDGKNYMRRQSNRGLGTDV